MMVQLGDGVTGNLKRTSLANKQNGMHSFKPDLFFSSLWLFILWRITIFLPKTDFLF